MRIRSTRFSIRPTVAQGPRIPFRVRAPQTALGLAATRKMGKLQVGARLLHFAARPVAAGGEDYLFTAGRVLCRTLRPWRPSPCTPSTSTCDSTAKPAGRWARAPGRPFPAWPERRSRARHSPRAPTTPTRTRASCPLPVTLRRSPGALRRVAAATLETAGTVRIGEQVREQPGAQPGGEHLQKYRHFRGRQRGFCRGRSRARRRFLHCTTRLAHRRARTPAFPPTGRLPPA